MRFDFQSNVLCLAHERPLLADRFRGWTPKDHVLTVENPLPEKNGAVMAVEPGEIYRFEGEGGPEAPVPNLVDVPLDHAIWRRSAVP